jgi:uroporphyrin-III C-methyltransferase/precorrin-2 dehydrogenase/sirohydrochlorin ferrochelatase
MSNVIPFKNREIEDHIDRRANNAAEGEVILLGAGPGDPDLLTVRGLRALQEADVVVYDRLVAPELLACTAGDCEKIYVGKRKDRHSLPQEKICELLVSLASSGKRVVRLKGGDPFVFGRGGEELDVLENRGISWQVIPGVTAAMGCAAATGIPLTHRACAHALTFITAHRQQGELAFNWDLALQKDQTVVFYMGLSVVGDIAAGLIERGKAADTPVAVIANGCRADQQVVVATLETVAERVRQSALPSPALIILGEVVTHRRALLDVAVGVSS